MMPRILAIAICVCFFSSSKAVSRLYDYEASAVIINGKPCFYTNRAVADETPNSLKGRGVRAEVFEAKGPMKWSMWSSQRLLEAPVSPDTCLLYGTISRDENLQLALELELEKPYYFALYGEYGRYRLYFCLLKDRHGETYLSRSVFSDGWKCTERRILPSRFDRNSI